jgi:DNA (cytosine-5)-methyltransferase 1
MSKLKVLDLFSGIGGFSLGLERTGGFETVAFCEIEEFPRKVLAKHWPEIPCYHDVTTLTADILERDGISVDVITGGFPCQDISVAGRQAGIEDGTRSGLWSEIVRLTCELRPRYVIVENVANLLSGPSERRGGWFGRILGDLAEIRYDAEWHGIPASAIGASHHRDRIWVIAWPSSGRDLADAEQIGTAWETDTGQSIKSKQSGIRLDEKRSPHLADAAEVRQSRPGLLTKWCGAGKNAARQAAHAVSSGELGEWAPEPALGRVVDGFPGRMDQCGALGNAVVPQIPEMIGHAILQAEAAA